MTIQEQKDEICDIGHRMWLKGFCAGNEGNLSVRVEEDRILCTPTGVSKGFLNSEMIMTVDLEGMQIGSIGKYKRTSEILLHLQIYKRRADVKAVVHSHPPHATAFACSGIAVPECVHPEAEFFIGKIKTAAYCMPGRTEVGQGVCALIDETTNTVLMGNHGSVCFSTSLMEAYYKLEILDSYCRLLFDLKRLGSVRWMTDGEMKELLELKKRYGLGDPRLESGEYGRDNGGFLKGLG